MRTVFFRLRSASDCSAQIASAHGFGTFGGLGGLGGSMLTPDQIVSRQQTIFQNEATVLGLSVDDIKNAWAAG